MTPSVTERCEQAVPFEAHSRKKSGSLIRHDLQAAGYSVESADTGTCALRRASESVPDLIILDLVLPGINGLLVCQALRCDPRTHTIPIIMVGPRTEAEGVTGLDMGADDYVTKPFSPRELNARVAALLRRVHRPARAATPVLKYRHLTIDVERHAVAFDGRDIQLPAKEFLLLQYVVERPGRVLSRDMLLTNVWGYQYTGGTRTVDVHIGRLRQKLPFLEEAIVTVKQFGYRLEHEQEYHFARLVLLLQSCNLATLRRIRPVAHQAFP